MLGEHNLGGCGFGARGKHIHTVGGEAREYLDRLLGSLACGEDDFGEAGAKTAVVVDAGVADVFEGEGREAFGGGLGRNGAAFDLGEELEKCGRCHEGYSLGGQSWKYAAMAACCTCLTAM